MRGGTWLPRFFVPKKNILVSKCKSRWQNENFKIKVETNPPTMWTCLFRDLIGNRSIIKELDRQSPYDLALHHRKMHISH